MLAVNNFGDTRSGGLAGPMGLFIIVLMSIAVVLLIRNMNKRLRRLPDSFPDPEEERLRMEIAELDADLDRPDATTDRPAPGGGPSRSAGVDPKSQVSEAQSTDDSTGDGATGRSA